jgi:hypothetical protein
MSSSDTREIQVPPFNENERECSESSSERLPELVITSNGSLREEIEQFLVKSYAQQIKERNTRIGKFRRF